MGKQTLWQNNSLALDSSRVIDRKVYVEDRIYEAEQKSLFGKTWQWVGHESEIAEFGEYLTASVAGRAVVIARGENDAIGAFYNTCTHRGAILAPLKRGKTDGSFTCLYHAWSFDTAGKLISVPLPGAYPENLTKNACYDIPQVRAELFNGHIFVCLDKDMPSLIEFLGPVAEHIANATHDDGVAIGRVRWTISGNWKLWHENFRDNYHPMFAHQILGQNYTGVKIEGENYDIGLGHSLLTFPSQGNPKQIMQTLSRVSGRKMAERPEILGRRTTDEPQRTRHNILAVFPNLDFQYTSAANASMVLQTVQPLGVDRAYVEIVVFGRRSDTLEMREHRLETALDAQTAAGKISGDDNEAAKRCSVGFSTIDAVRWSNMDRGQEPGTVGAKNDEYSLRAFYVTYKEYLHEALAELA